MEVIVCVKAITRDASVLAVPTQWFQREKDQINVVLKETSCELRLSGVPYLSCSALLRGTQGCSLRHLLNSLWAAPSQEHFPN